MADLYNQQAETLTLAGMLGHPEAYWTVNAVGLTPEDFLGTENRKVMKAILSVVSEKKQPDLPLVLDELAMYNGETNEYVLRLTGMSCSVPQAAEYAGLVKGLSMSRHLVSAGARIVEIAEEKRASSEEALSLAENELRQVRDQLPRSTRSSNPADIIRRLKEAGPERGIPIHFAPSLHDMSGGYIPGHLWVVGGFSSTGKSAVACNIIKDVAVTEREPVGLVSTEMTQENYTQRMLSLLSGVRFRDIRDRFIVGEVNLANLHDAEARLSVAPLAIYDTVYKISDIRLKAIMLKETTGLSVLLVDFIQNVRGSKGDFAFQDMTEITLDLQQIAKDLQITVIAFSQLSNDMARYQAEGGDDNFYGFKGSGAIKDAADFAILLKRDRVRQSPMLDFHVLKNRHGELRVINTLIDLPTGRIDEVSREDYQE